MGWEGLKDHLVSTPCCGKRHLQLDQVGQNPIQPGTEHFHGWGRRCTVCPSTRQGLENKEFGSRKVTTWLWWEGICEWKKLLSTIDLKINTTIPVCNRNTLTVSPLLMKEANAPSVSVCESINTQNIQKHLQSSSESELAQRKHQFCSSVT